MLAFQLDSSLFLNEGKLFFRFDADFLFLIRHRSRSLDLIGEFLCLVCDQLIERLERRQYRSCTPTCCTGASSVRMGNPRFSPIWAGSAIVA